MKNSSSRILTTHIGSLARPPEILEILRAKETGQPYDIEALAGLVRQSVQEVVRRQVQTGIDVPSDGEYGKPSFSTYVQTGSPGLRRGPSSRERARC